MDINTHIDVLAQCKKKKGMIHAVMDLEQVMHLIHFLGIPLLNIYSILRNNNLHCMVTIKN